MAETSVPTRPPDADSVVRFHPLRIRPSDDDPDSAIVGRSEVGEFIELPAIGAEAIELLAAGVPLGEVERRLGAEHDVELDLAELVEALQDAGMVAEVDGRPVVDPYPDTRVHLPGLTADHVSWLFGTPAKLCYLAFVALTVLTVVRRPDLLPTYRNFFWTDYIGLAVLVNTAMFSVSATVHELSHLAAARSLGAPARITFATRLHHLVLQTDVTAIWAVPRKYRYRVYFSGIHCDLAAASAATLLIAYAPLPSLAERLLGAFVILTVMSMALQLHVYMRTDVYFVLLELLRCRNLFHDGLAWARHLLRRLGHPVLPARVAAPGADPSAELPAHERRAVRIYAVAVVVGSSVALTSFAVFGIPILVHGFVSALSAVLAVTTGGGILPAVDGALVLLVEGTLQVVFLATLYRRHIRRRLRGA